MTNFAPMKQLILICLLTFALFSFKGNKQTAQTFHFQLENSFSKDTLKIRTMVFADFFSPNGDGFNDVFTIQNVEDYPENNIKIVNRWGEVVYRAVPYKNDWNGKNNISGPLFGNDCQDGVYFFEFYDGVGTTATGKITLKR